MKKQLAIAGAFAAALALAACGDRNAEEEGPIAEASSETGVGSNPASNTVQDAASAVVGPTSAVTLGRTTGGFVTNAAIGDMYEIEAGRLAATKAKNAGVKSFAAMLVKDHTAMSNELKSTLGTANAGADITIPTAMDERRTGMIDNLKQAPADQFDKVFIAQQVAAHREAKELLQTYVDAGDNAPLKAHASKGLPKIQAHLTQAETIEKGL